MDTGKVIYLDYNATTPVDDRVLAAMLPYLKHNFGNPSSAHVLGLAAQGAVKEARRGLAALLGSSADEIIFTSGGTESNNHAIRGVAQALSHKGRHIITSVFEHPAVLETLKALEKQGFSVTYVPVNQFGMVSADDVESAIRPDTILITIMHSNNEVGTLQPIDAIARIAKKQNIIVHTDAAQSVGKVPVNVAEMGVDLLSVAGHKMYAPKGIGALYVRDGLKLPNLMYGASQEFGRRPGTESVASIVALGRAAELAAAGIHEESRQLAGLRDELHSLIETRLGPVKLNGHPTQRLSNTLNLSFFRLDVAQILSRIPEVAVSTRAACHSCEIAPSHVLVAMGVETSLAQNAMRISVGRYTTKTDIEKFVTLLESRL